jgi:hypothetical protein
MVKGTTLWKNFQKNGDIFQGKKGFEILKIFGDLGQISSFIFLLKSPPICR